MDRTEYIYYKFMKKVVEDGFISLDESGLIMILEERLGLSDDQMDDIMGMIQEEESPEEEEMERLSKVDTEHRFEKDIYERVLKEACGDEMITDRELEIMEELAKIMAISIEERRKIYENVTTEEDISRRLGKALKLD